MVPSDYSELARHYGGFAGDAIAIVAVWAGRAAAHETWWFFSATIRNPNTRRAYHRAVTRFIAWCAARGIDLRELNAPLVAAHIDELKQTLQRASVKIHLATLRHWCDQLVLGHVLPFNRAAAV